MNVQNGHCTVASTVPEIAMAAPNEDSGRHIQANRLPQLGGDGAGTRIRTADLLITNQLLYQLSYSSIAKGAEYIRASRPWVSAGSRDGTRDQTRAASRAGVTA